MHAERCPVCCGTGKKIQKDLTPQSWFPVAKTPCHGCGGSGWVEVRDDVRIAYPGRFPPQGFAEELNDNAERKMTISMAKRRLRKLGESISDYEAGKTTTLKDAIRELNVKPPYLS